MKQRGLFLFYAALTAAHGQPLTLNVAPSRVVGHARLVLSSNTPNLVEGRELNGPQGVALDTSVSPPILYVADTANNRVLAWRNATQAQDGSPADMVLGQRDRFSTFPMGPGTTLTTGLSSPTGLAVDRQGNLYVADSGNNRVVRYVRPLQQTDELPVVDLVLGQKSSNARLANEGGSSPTAETLAFAFANVAALRVGLAFDAQQNLYVSDAGNHRVLRYNALSLDTSAPRNGPAADLVVGQPGFTTRTSLNQFANEVQLRKDGMITPSGITVDSSGRLYVIDLLNRVLVYERGFQNGSSASRIMGVVVLQAGQTPPPAVNNIGLGLLAVGPTFIPPEGVFMIGNRPAVLDSPKNRILIYDPPEQWAAEATQFSPPARTVVGQADFSSSRANRAQAAASADSLNFPVAAIATGNTIFVADTSNHRVLQFEGTPGTAGGIIYTAAARVFGQPGMIYNSANLIEGRELYLVAGFQSIPGSSAIFAAGSAGLLVDQNRLYVADAINNRVLGWRDVRSVRPGDRADLVIGQPDFFRAQVNYPSNDPNLPTDSSLFGPAGLAVDAAGNLWVADSGNGRVLRFPRPFDQPQGATQRADLVLGQSNFTSKNIDASSRNMRGPHGLAFTVDGHLLVSDAVHNRVLLFLRPASGAFTNGQAATVAFGQPDFISSSPGGADNRLLSPRMIATDSSDRLYVCDTGNNRVLIYDRAPAAGTDPNPAFVVGGLLRSPHGIYINSRTGEIWVADTQNARALRFPTFDTLVVSQAADAQIPLANASGPLGIALDSFGNLLIADTNNRISLHYPGHASVNAANFIPRPIAPGTVSSLFAQADLFGTVTRSFNELPNPVPLPTEIEDVQVLFNDQPVPLYFVSPRQINFLTPMNAPSSGTVEVQVVRKSVGQILASSPVRMDAASTGFFTLSRDGNGQLAALNQDNTVNGSSNPIARGQIISLFGTGQGFVPGAPPDGTPPTGPVSTPERPRVFIGTDFVPDGDVTYSGLAPSLVGVWQINVRIPISVLPGSAVPVVIQLRSIPNSLRPQVTTIAVRQ